MIRRTLCLRKALRDECYKPGKLESCVLENKRRDDQAFTHNGKNGGEEKEIMGEDRRKIQTFVTSRRHG